MTRLKRHILEAMTVIGFVISASSVTKPEFAYFLGGVSISALTCILLFEATMLRSERATLAYQRETDEVLKSKDENIAELESNLSDLADPELRELERQRAKAQFEWEQETIKKNQAENEKARQQQRKIAEERSNIYNEHARNILGLPRSDSTPDPENRG